MEAKHVELEQNLFRSWKNVKGDKNRGVVESLHWNKIRITKTAVGKHATNSSLVFVDSFG